MIHAIRKLARAIRRRSVWSVLAVYLVGSWLSIEAVSWMTRAAGLPGWTTTLALVLLVMLLPLIVATAVVQGGLPGLRMEDAVDPNELVGLTPQEVHVVPEAHPLHEASLLTWRNTVLGGVTSAALLVTSVVAYMVMWAFGIGPVGSLLAQGVVGDQDPVALVAFQSDTDDTSLADLITQAVRLELARSTVVALLDAEDGGRLVVSGDVSRTGPDYVISARIAVSDGSVVARFEETSTVDEILGASVRLSERLRERIGEPLRTIREGDRSAPITTDDPEAFGLLLRGERRAVVGDFAGALRLVREAVAVDPAFAMGWLRLGELAEEAGDPQAAREAYGMLIDLWAAAGPAQRTVTELRARVGRAR